MEAPESAEAAPGLYVYAVVPAAVPVPADPPGIGGARIEAVCHGSLAVLTSPVGSARIRPSRANLTAHERVVGAAHARGPVLPIRFGTVMPDETTLLEELLLPDRNRLESLLDEFEGKDEYRVKFRYLPDLALREVVERSGAIRRLRAKLLSLGPAASQAASVRLGELVAAELERLRWDDASRLLNAMAPHVAAWEPVEDGSDDVPLHAALLVDRGRAPGLEAALGKIASDQRDRMHVELIGPLPLWDFSRQTAGAA